MYILKGMTSIYNMEKRYCKRCNSTKDADLFYEDRKYCMRCLDKEKEKHQRHRKDLNILKNIMKNIRTTEKITGRHIVKLK